MDAGEMISRVVFSLFPLSIIFCISQNILFLKDALLLPGQLLLLSKYKS